MVPENQLDLPARRAIASCNAIGAASEVTAQAHLKLRADAGAISRVEAFVAAFAAQHGICNDDRARALILLEELITNLLNYGYPDRTQPGAAEVVLLVKEGRLTIELIDDGGAFDPFAAPAPDFSQPLEARSPGGLGLHIVRVLTERRDYSRVNDRNVTRLTLHLGAPAAP
jgi:anti-sigma regulatory factor (Ser/Thr protein kinase)